MTPHVITVEVTQEQAGVREGTRRSRAVPLGYTREQCLRVFAEQVARALDHHLGENEAARVLAHAFCELFVDPLPPEAAADLVGALACLRRLFS